MSEKINIDGVRFKVDANLDKLAEDLKKGEGVAKKGGEAMGKAAGKGFDQSLKSDVNKTLDDVKKTAESSSSALTGIFGKVGAAVAGAFALDKVVGFFKDSMKYASDMEEQMGSVSKATKDVREDFEALGKNTIWDKIKLGIGNFLNSIVDGFKAVAVAASDLFKSSDRVVQLYHREKESVKALGDEMTRLSSINKRTAEEELKLISLKEQLSEKAKKLGLDYDKLVASGKSYVQILNEIQNASKLRAQADLSDKASVKFTEATSAAEQYRGFQDRIANIRSGRELIPSSTDRAALLESLNSAALFQKNIAEKARAEGRVILDQMNLKDQKNAPAASFGSGAAIEQHRFIDSRLRIETINRNRRDTDSVINSDRSITEEERRRRLQMSAMEARQAIDYEVNSLRAGYAQFIEETHSAKMLAIKSEADNARRLSYELLEAELKQSGDNEKKIEKAKKESAARLSKIAEAETRKQAALTAESFAKTMQAANQIAAGLSQGGAAGVGATMAGGGALGSALTSGGIISGSSGVSRFLSASGIIGPLIGLGSSLASGLSGLFGKSEEERKREIETARAIAERQHQEQMLILEQQAQYQKAMLAIQEANSRTPFENLQRNLRLLDIKEQQAVLSGTPSDIARKQTLQSKLSAMQSILQSEGGKISADTLFSGTGTSPDELIQFLNTRKSQEAYVNSAVGAYNSAAGLNFQSFGTPEGVAALDNYFRSALGNIESNRANLPETFANMLADRLRQALGLLDYGSTRTQGFGGYLSGQLRSALDPGLGDSLLSEINRDTGIAENMLSVIEQSLQTQNEIKDATKRTAANTSRLVDTPNRSSSLIDISRGLTRSLGQVISGPDLTNTALPNGVRAAVLATDIQKSIQERAADGIDRLNDTARKQLELLAIMVTILKNPSNVSPLTVAQLEDLYRRSGIRIAA